jgi:signal transduction histidine kinase
LTNAAKHAPESTVRVELVREVGELGLVVRSTGRPADVSGPAGHGLVGMAERVRLYDGRLVAEPTPDGFVVDARFPL